MVPVTPGVPWVSVLGLIFFYICLTKNCLFADDMVVYLTSGGEDDSNPGQTFCVTQGYVISWNTVSCPHLGPSYKTKDILAIKSPVSYLFSPCIMWFGIICFPLPPCILMFAGFFTPIFFLLRVFPHNLLR